MSNNCQIHRYIFSPFKGQIRIYHCPVESVFENTRSRSAGFFQKPSYQDSRSTLFSTLIENTDLKIWEKCYCVVHKIFCMIQVKDTNIYLYKKLFQKFSL